MSLTAVELGLLGDTGPTGAIIQLVLTIVTPLLLLVVLYFVVKAAVKKGMKETIAERQGTSDSQTHSL